MIFQIRRKFQLVGNCFNSFLKSEKDRNNVEIVSDPSFVQLFFDKKVEGLRALTTFMKFKICSM